MKKKKIENFLPRISFNLLGRKSSSAGFTLVELMVAVFIFTLVLGTLSGFFIGALQAQRKALALQELIDSVSYNLEYMGRAIRMARKDLHGTCIESKYNYKLTRDKNGLEFLNYDNVCQEFFIQGGRLYESKEKGLPLALTPDGIEILSFKIGSDESWGQQETQPRVTIFLEARAKGDRPELQSEIKVQTTISQRNLNATY